MTTDHIIYVCPQKRVRIVAKPVAKPGRAQVSDTSWLPTYFLLAISPTIISSDKTRQRRAKGRRGGGGQQAGEGGEQAEGSKRLDSPTAPPVAVVETAPATAGETGQGAGQVPEGKLLFWLSPHYSLHPLLQQTT